jgi:hypothetical protein
MKQFIKQKLHEVLNSTIPINILPDDLQMLLFQFFEDSGIELPNNLPLI